MKTTVKTARGKQRQFQAGEKVSILRRHLIEKVTVSDLCDEHKISPSVYYRWQTQFFEGGEKAFATTAGQSFVQHPPGVGDESPAHLKCVYRVEWIGGAKSRLLRRPPDGLEVVHTVLLHQGLEEAHGQHLTFPLVDAGGQEVMEVVAEEMPF